MYTFNSKEELSQFIASEVINTSEARVILNNCSRQYISELVSKEKLKPIRGMIGDSIFFKSDIKILKKKKTKGALNMSVIKDIIKELLSGDRKAKIKIDDYLYLKLMDEAKMDNYMAEAIVNKILYERYENIEKERKVKEEQEKQEKELIEYYKVLDKYLYATLNNNIEIGITNDSIGRDEKEYTLIDYSLSKVSSRLSLKLQRNGEAYPISFNNIQDIKFHDNGTSLKAWIYMTKETWRFYLKYDNQVVAKLENNFSSGKLKIAPEVLPYEKYKNVDNLKYHLEKKKYDLNVHYEGEKLVKDKRGDLLYLINFFDKDTTSFYEKTGDIYFVSELGNQGKLFYSIKSNIFDKEKEDYMEIVDVLPEEYNAGIGTEALKYLEEIAIKNNVKHIVGELSPMDLENHKDRLIHFYEKNGYQIKGNRISKDL